MFTHVPSCFKGRTIFQRMLTLCLNISMKMDQMVLWLKMNEKFKTFLFKILQDLTTICQMVENKTESFHTFIPLHLDLKFIISKFLEIEDKPRIGLQILILYNLTHL